jgi:hypothetical protein
MSVTGRLRAELEGWSGPSSPFPTAARPPPKASRVACRNPLRHPLRHFATPRPSGAAAVHPGIAQGRFPDAMLRPRRRCVSPVAIPRCTRPLRNGGSPFVRVRARIGATQPVRAPQPSAAPPVGRIRTSRWRPDLLFWNISRRIALDSGEETRATPCRQQGNFDCRPRNAWNSQTPNMILT